MTQPIELPASVRREESSGGLACYAIENAHATARIYEHGAHVAAFQPRSSAHAVLWLSQQSMLEDDKPIRGGVPLCFPWFGPRGEDSNAPMHGLARTSPWLLSQASEDANGTSLVFVPSPELEDKGLWPKAEVSLRVLVGQSLQLSFSVQAREQACSFEIALHSYFCVGDVRLVEVSGLEGASFWDKVRRTQQRGDRGPIRIAGETDRVYTSASTCTVSDASWRRDIVIEKESSGSTVVWNPGAAKAKAMPDFGDDEWSQMLCIETANVGRHRIELAHGASHTTTARISVRDAV